MATQTVDPRALTFSSWNVNVVSQENMTKLKESIRRNGIFRPIVVRERSDGQLEVIAGEHTTRVAIELGHQEIDVYNLGPIDDRKAKEISIIDNQHYGVEDTYGLGALLREIGDDPASFLPFSDTEMDAIFKSTSINFDDLELPDDDGSANLTAQDDFDESIRAPVTHAVMRFKVPIADQELVTRVIEGIARRQGFKDSDSLTNAGDALVYLAQNYAE
jgi:hypothetical protein